MTTNTLNSILVRAKNRIIAAKHGQKWPAHETTALVGQLRHVGQGLLDLADVLESDNNAKTRR